MKKVLRYLLLIILILVAGFLYYYITLPAVNIHSVGFWMFILGAFILLMALYALKHGKKSFNQGIFSIDLGNKSKTILKIGGIILGVMIIIFVAGYILSSPIVNAKKYQQLLTVEKRNFTDDFSVTDFSTIPLLDKASAEIIGERKMGSLVEMVSQFEVGTDYTQINYNDKPVRVTPLVYASPIKWLTNQKTGIPAYLMIDMVTQDTTVVQLDKGIKYSKSEYFNHNIYRYLRFNFPTYIFSDQIFFEIDEDGIPYWVCPVKKFNIGLFGGETVDRVVLVNAQTGALTDYNVKDVPQWIDKVYSAELLVELYDYSGSLVNGYFNSILGQKNCLQTTEGYNYLAIEDDVWVYTGVTSVSGDQSNVGFVLMNQRTMETRYYEIEGAMETSAMSSAEGQVQHLGYISTFPLLINVASEPTYIMALKDDAGLVKMYAMVNVQKYQLVATGDSVKECEKNYITLLNNNGIASEDSNAYLEAAGKIQSIAPIVIEGTTHYYVCLENNQLIFDLDMSEETLLEFIRYQVGDQVTFTYADSETIKAVREIQ
jgi:hypothetical protein